MVPAFHQEGLPASAFQPFGSNARLPRADIGSRRQKACCFIFEFRSLVVLEDRGARRRQESNIPEIALAEVP